MSFRTKLLAAFLLVSVVLVAGAMGLASQAATDAARDKIQRDFDRAAGQMDQVVRDRLASFDDVSEAALSDPLFRSQLGNTMQTDDAMGLGGNGLGDGDGTAGESPVAQAHGVFASAELPLFQRYPVMVVVNAESTLLFTKADMARFGGSVKDVPAIARALKDGKAVELWSGRDEKLRALGLIPEKAEDELFLIMARRVATRDGAVGAVIAGEASGGLLRQMAALSGSDVALASTTQWVSTGQKEVFGFVHERKDSRQFQFDGETLLAMAVPIEGVGQVYMARSLSKEIKPFNDRLSGRLVVVFIASILISIFAGALIARRLSGPLRSLDRAAQQVRKGDLSVRVPVGSKDEIGRLAHSFNEMTEGLQQRDQIKATFKRYLAPAVVEELIKNPDKLQLGGESRELSILFSDLVGFTSLSEGRPAHELVSLLNEYFDEVGQAIVRRGGTLDKFAGDSVMCFFGAPLELPDHRQRAILSGLEHLRAVDDIQKRWVKLGRPVIDCRIGVNSGPVVVGNIGSRDGQDYTVIGDAVNLASRLEGVNKEYGSRLIVSEDTLKGSEAAVLARELDMLRVKGKNVPVRIFEVLCEVHEATSEQKAMVQRFAQGLAAYRSKQFDVARAVFASCLQGVPNDGPSQTFLERCDFFITTPPEADWDGVWKMTTK